MKELKDLKNLTWLDLSGTYITDAGLKELKDLKNLTWLNLSGTDITDAGLKELKNLKNLTTLYLKCTWVTDAGLKELKRPQEHRRTVAWRHIRTVESLYRNESKNNGRGPEGTQES